eukprot:SAG31_NODE_7315_length_1721_cov_2.720715_1_plen_66_part_00
MSQIEEESRQRGSKRARGVGSKDRHSSPEIAAREKLRLASQREVRRYDEVRYSLTDVCLLNDPLI